MVSVSDSFEFRIGVRSGSALPLLLDGDSRPAILTPTDIGMGRSLSLIFSCYNILNCVVSVQCREEKNNTKMSF